MYNNMTGCRYKCPCLVRYTTDGSYQTGGKVDIYVNNNKKYTFQWSGTYNNVFDTYSDPNISDDEGVLILMNDGIYFILKHDNVFEYYKIPGAALDDCFPNNDIHNYNDYVLTGNLVRNYNSETKSVSMNKSNNLNG